MQGEKKVLGEERRELLLTLLKNSKEPITGSDLANQTNVSRQVIVGDVSLLKAKGEPIMATSQGYMFLSQVSPSDQKERAIVCTHPPERTEEELNLLVDHGVTVKDVKIEHPMYGDLTASLMVSNRKEVKQFIKKMNTTNAAFLCELTDGIHIHTITATSEDLLDDAEDALRQVGMLVD